MKDPAKSSDDRALGDEPTLRPDPGPAGAQGDLAPGTMVSEYRIERELGRGGMGVVYAGVQPVIGKRVAIKVLGGQLAGDPALTRRFADEARAVNRIGHPNIIDIFAFGTLADGRQYFVMELLEGETLEERLARAPLPLAEACQLLSQVADALEAAHREQIVHRDLKPENLWIARPRHGDAFIKVLDFGIAKLLAETAQRGLTATGMVIGTPHYMAPEQCMGERVDHRADLYALGVILYRVFAGKLPFDGASFAEIVSQHVLGKPQRPGELSDVPPALDVWIMACLEKDPAQRPQSAAAVADALRAIAAGKQPLLSGVHGLAARRPELATLRPEATGRTRRAWLWAALLFVAVALGLAARALLPSAPDSTTVPAARAEPAAPSAPHASTAPAPAANTSPGPVADDAVPATTAEPPAQAPAQRPRRATDTTGKAGASRVEQHGLIEENPFE